MTGRTIRRPKHTGKITYAQARKAVLKVKQMRAEGPAMYKLINDLLNIWNPQWEPGKTAHAEARAILERIDHADIPKHSPRQA